MIKANRRTFLKSASISPLAMAPFALGSGPVTARATETATPVLLGGPVFTPGEDPEKYAEAHLEWGYGAGYAPEMTPDDGERIRATVKAFESRNLVIAEVGAWVNLVDPDPGRRAKNLDYVAQKLTVADELGARCCVDITGSFDPDRWDGPHPENFSQEFFDASVESVRKVIDAVKPKRTHFSIEMMGWTIPSTVDEYLRLIKAVDREQFGVHVDVCNMINSPKLIYRSRALIEEVFTHLGRWIVSCHAKDVGWIPSSQVQFTEVIPGRGLIDYQAYLRELSKLPTPTPLMLEHLKKPEEYREGGDFIRKVGNLDGIPFS